MQTASRHQWRGRLALDKRAKMKPLPAGGRAINAACMAVEKASSNAPAPAMQRASRLRRGDVRMKVICLALATISRREASKPWHQWWAASAPSSVKWPCRAGRRGFANINQLHWRPTRFTAATSWRLFLSAFFGMSSLEGKWAWAFCCALRGVLLLPAGLRRSRHVCVA